MAEGSARPELGHACLGQRRAAITSQFPSDRELRERGFETKKKDSV